MLINIKGLVLPILEAATLPGMTASKQKRMLVPKEKKKDEPLHKTDPNSFGSVLEQKRKSLFGGPETTKNNTKILAGIQKAKIKASAQ